MSIFRLDVGILERSNARLLNGTPLAGSKIYIGGTASTYKDIQEMAHYDLTISSGILPAQQ